MSDRTATASIESELEPNKILEILVDPMFIPQWAPEFADDIAGAEDHGWQVRKDGRMFYVNTEVSETARTVDYIREISPGKQGGAYLRVLPRPGGGSVVVITVPIPAGLVSQSVRLGLDAELRSLALLAQSRAGQ
jgi:hypothetical protein